MSNLKKPACASKQDVLELATLQFTVIWFSSTIEVTSGVSGVSGNPKDLAEYNRRTNIQSKLKKLFLNENSYYVCIVTEQALLSPQYPTFLLLPTTWIFYVISFIFL